MSKPGAYEYEAIIIGAGPNGLSAAITLARAGCNTLLIEAKDTIGGGTRTAEVTLPGFRHDICSAIHPLGVASPFLRGLPLADYGLEWITPPLSFGHPLDDGTGVSLQPSVISTAEQLGKDAPAYRRFMQPLVDDWGKIEKAVLGPLPVSTHLLPARIIHCVEFADDLPEFVDAVDQSHDHPAYGPEVAAAFPEVEVVA